MAELERNGGERQVALDLLGDVLRHVDDQIDLVQLGCDPVIYKRSNAIESKPRPIKDWRRPLYASIVTSEPSSQQSHRRNGWLR